MLYRVFISHAYDHRDIYFALVQKLNGVRSFEWRNVSVQYDMRLGHENEQLSHDDLREVIGSRIRECDVLLALTKPIVARRAWLQWEIRLAKELGIPIVGIARKRNDNVSRFVREHADDIVDTWRIDHIINAIEITVAEARGRHPQTMSVIVPPLLPSQPDEELVIVHSPVEAPPPAPEFAEADRLAEALATAADPPTSPSPREVIFRDFGRTVPERPFAHVMPQRPKWWSRFATR